MKNYTWETIPAERWSDFSGSDKYEAIVSVLGLANKRIDILHLDSAFKNGCEVFITNDKKDIWIKRTELEPLLNMRIFSVDEINDCIAYIEQC